MASLTACSRLLVLICGERLALVDFSCPEEAVILNLPETKNAAPQSKPHNGKKNLKNEESGNDKEQGSDGTETKPVGSSSSNRILAADVSSDGQYLAVCDDHKYLHVFQARGSGVRSWTLINSRCVTRRCTTVRFDEAHGKVLVADKSGDVFAFAIHPAARSPQASKDDLGPSQGQDGQSEDDGQAMDRDQDEETGGSQLILGHLSMLLDMVLLGDDNLIVTADRDEKIRVSRYPDSYNIHAYCLGHTAFVISLAYDSERHLLFSGSGDCTVRVWNYQDGKELTRRSCLEDLPAEAAPSSGGSEAVNPGEETRCDENLNNKAKAEPKPEPGTTPQAAVQQISYCQDCALLFVAMHRWPDIIVYQVVPATSPSGAPTLVPLPPITGRVCSHVVSLCIQGCVLWCVRQVDSDVESSDGFSLQATKVEHSGAGFKVTDVAPDGECPESKILETMSQQADFFKNAPPSQDLSILWKSHIDGYVDEYLERKRQRMEGVAKEKGHRQAKHKKL